MKKFLFSSVVLFVSVLFLCSSAFATLMSAELVNEGVYPGAAGTLYWNSVDTSFSGLLEVSGLNSADMYQMKIEAPWGQGGENLSLFGGRAWDETIWQDTGDVHLANVGNYLSTSDIWGLVNNDNHDVKGYFMFDYFTVDPDGTATIPFYAEDSWHVAGDIETADIIMPDDFYHTKFIITREWQNWLNPLTAENIDFTVAPVPEPATMLLLGSGLIGLAGLGRKKFFKKS